MFELQNKSLNLADCLDILVELYKSGKREFIDLIYIDPPFNSDRNYNIPFEGGELSEKAFADTWSRIGYLDQLDMVSKISPRLYKFLVSIDQTDIPKSYITYLTVMGIRVFLMREMLKPTGSFYYHCDPTASHYVKMMLDMIFGMENFRREIVWQTGSGSWGKSREGGEAFPYNHNIILFYGKSSKTTTKKHFTLLTEEQAIRKFPIDDKDGNGPYIWNVLYKFTDEQLKEGIKNGTIKWPEKNKFPVYKQYLRKHKGNPITDVWNDISHIIRTSKECLGYPTQKPEKLLERVILASTNPGDLVADFYLGGGTTIAVAEKLDRNWIGIDINPRAIEISEQRIKDLGKQLKKDFIISGIPKSSKELRKLIEDNVYGKDKNSKFALEDIVCKYYLKNVVGNEKKVGDDSIDGRFTFDFKNEKHSGIVQVTVSGNKNHLKNSCETMAREGHSMLVYVTFEDKITDPLIELSKKYKKIGGVDRVQLLSLEDLIDKGKQFDLPKDENSILGFDLSLK